MVHVFICSDLSQDMLVSADDCEALGLLPRHWPNHDEEQANTAYSKLYRANNVVTTKEKKEKEEDGKVNLTELQEALWSNTGDI